MNEGAIVIDTNLLLLLVVGRMGSGKIGRHKRLKGYDGEDYDRLDDIVCSFPRTIVTPNVLAETSNLLGLRDSPDLAVHFKQIIMQVLEVHVPGRTASLRPEFEYLGLTDAALMDVMDDGASSGRRVLLTTDAKLADAVGRCGHAVINFNHGRGLLPQ